MERYGETEQQEKEKHGAEFRVNSFRLYFRTLGFVVKRGKYYVLAALFFLAYWLLIGELNILAPNVMEAIGWLIKIINTFFLLFLVSLIAGWNKRRNLLGQIGIITRSFHTGTVPENAFRTGLMMARDRFHGLGVSRIIKDSIGFLFKAAFKRNRGEGELRMQILLLLQEIVSLLVLMIAGLFGEFGSCLIAYFYRCPEAEVNVRSMLKAGRRYFRHLGGMLAQMLLSLVIWIGVMLSVAVPAAFGICRLCEGTFADVFLRGILTEMYPSIDQAGAGGIILGFVFALMAILISMLITDPFGKIRMVRYYLDCFDRDGDERDNDLDAGLTRLRAKLHDKVHRQRKCPDNSQK